MDAGAGRRLSRGGHEAPHNNQGCWFELPAYRVTGTSVQPTDEAICGQLSSVSLAPGDGCDLGLTQIPMTKEWHSFSVSFTHCYCRSGCKQSSWKYLTEPDRAVNCLWKLSPLKYGILTWFHSESAEQYDVQSCYNSSVNQLVERKKMNHMFFSLIVHSFSKEPIRKVSVWVQKNGSEHF